MTQAPKVRLWRTLFEWLRTRAKALAAATIVVLVVLGAAEALPLFYQPALTQAVNPYPKLWTSWGAALSYVPSPVSWKDLGPGSGPVDLVVPDPSQPGTIFAGGRFIGLYRSGDWGATWQPASVGLGQYFVTALAPDPWHPGIVYAVADGTFFRSTDEGTGWSPLPQCSRSAVSILAAKTLGLLYLGCSEQFMVSRDDGASWKASPLPQDVSGLAWITQGPGVIMAMAVGSSQNYTVLRSTDIGASWAEFSTPWHAAGGTFRPMLAIDPSNPEVILANAPYGTMQSLDGGASWSQAVNDSYGMTGGFVGFDQDNSTAYAGRVELYRGDTLGATFTRVGSWNIDCVGSPELVYHADVGAIAFARGGRDVLLGTDGGVDVSYDGGHTWQCTSGGIMSGLTYDVGVDPFDSSHLIATRQDYYPAQSYDYGRSWQTIYQIQSEWGSVRFDPISRGTVYIASGGGVWKSTDSGRDFALSGSGLPNVPFPSSPRLTIDEGNPSTLWLSLGALGLYKSGDRAASWQKVPAFAFSQQVDSRGPVVYAVANRGGLGGIWKSTDGGGSFTRLSLPLTEQYYEVKIDPYNSTIVYVVGAELHVSLDGGKTFRSATIPPDLTANQLGTFGPSPYTLFVQRIGNLSRIVIAAAKFGAHANVYESFDRGSGWLPITGNLNATMVMGITSNPSYPIQLYLATFGGGVLEEGVEVPLTVSYGISGSALRFSVPTVMFVKDGTYASSPLSMTGQTYLADWGTFWTVSTPNPEGPYTGRLSANGTTAGVATVPEDVRLVFNFTQ